MASKPKPKIEKPKADPVLEFGNPDWMAEREEQLDHEMAGHDFSKDLNIGLRWDGWYKFRVVTVTDMKNWLRAYGEHWNWIPGPDGKMTQGDGCPLVTRNLPCPICFAVDQAIQERKAPAKDFFEQGGIGVQRKYLLLVLLLEADLRKKDSSDPVPPKFTDLPELKVLELPKSVAQEFRSLVNDKDWGWVALMHPEDGVVIKVTKDSSKPGTKRYDVKPLRETFALPDEWFEYEVVENDEGEEVKRIVEVVGMPNLEDFLPKTTTEDLMGKIEKHQHEINPYVANYNLSIPVGSGNSQKALPPGGEDRPSTKDSMAALRERMKKSREKSGK